MRSSARSFPRAGGQYVYLRDAYHPLAGFLYGWALLALIESGAIAAVAIAFANYALRLTGRPDIAPAPLAIAAVVLLSLVNYLGVKPGSRVLNVLVVLKVAALAVLIGFGAFAPAHPGWWTAARETSAPPLTTVVAFGAALVPILFAYGGWQNANYVAEEIENPRRNLPLSLIAGTIAVVVIYVLVNIVYLRALGLEGLAATTTPASDAAERMFGALGDRFVTAAIAISTFGFLDLAILAPTRVYYAMAADGLFFPALANLHPTYQNAGAGHRAPVGVVLRPGAQRHVRATPELRRLCRLDFLRPDGRDRARVPPDVSTRAASAGFVPGARVSRCADRLRRRCGSRRAERRLGRSGRRAARHAPARRRHPRLLLVQPPHTMTTLRFHAPYMEWAKARVPPRFDLANSNILPCSIEELTGARDAIALTGHNENGYAPLVESIAARYGVLPAQVTTAQGASGANFLVCAALLEPGDDVLVERPGYDPLLGAPRLLGARVVRFDRDPADGFALDPDAVRRAMTPRTRLIIVTSPHNPTGVVVDDAALDEVGRIAAAQGAYVLVDEVYLDASVGVPEVRLKPDATDAQIRLEAGCRRSLSDHQQPDQVVRSLRAAVRVDSVVGRGGGAASTRARRHRRHRIDRRRTPRDAGVLAARSPDRADRRRCSRSTARSCGSSCTRGPSSRWSNRAAGPSCFRGCVASPTPAGSRSACCTSARRRSCRGVSSRRRRTSALASAARPARSSAASMPSTLRSTGANGRTSSLVSESPVSGLWSHGLLVPYLW